MFTYVASSTQNILRYKPTLLEFGESLSVLTPEVEQGWMGGADDNRDGLFIVERPPEKDEL